MGGRRDGTEGIVRAALHVPYRAPNEALADAISVLDEPWKAETTANNLRMIADAREAAGIPTPETREFIAELEKRGPRKAEPATA